jgi:alkylation response protein AidB-like acyl-CoA dehydrogenase
MDFALTEEQRLFDATLRGYLAAHLPLERLRALAETGTGFDETLWQGLCELGLQGLLVPERFGGSGLGVLDAAVAAEALGAAVAPVPFVGLAMATLAVRQAGTPAQQDAWLPRIADTEALFGVGFAGLAGQTGEATATLAKKRLTGRITGALDCGLCSHLLVVLDDGRMAIVATDDPGVRMTPRASLDRTRPVTDLAFDAAQAEVLSATNAPLETALRVLDAGRVLVAAGTLGTAQAMLDRAVAFAKERVQFGRVIGSFQGVKYMLADMVTMLEPCRGLVWYAAHAQDAQGGPDVAGATGAQGGPDVQGARDAGPREARLTACHAKAHLGDVAREVSRMATEAHGGMGFTDLLGLHFWFKRIAFNRQILGGPERCREEAAILQGWAT